MTDRERLIQMISGDRSRGRVIPLRFGEDISDEFDIDPSEVDSLMKDGQEDLFLLRVRPETREAVLRDSPCLVRQPDGRFKARNIGKQGPVYIVD